ncbi:MAG: hypothetical protein K0Q51_832 [Rickettsiaceae bacterium]|jgi:polar amino acid transport system substrate-binding protein|nr:hypothetical protein [Rickettsiaceae bacterium]
MIRYLIVLLISCCLSEFSYSDQSLYNGSSAQLNQTECPNIKDNLILKAAWDVIPPYEYKDAGELKGIDLDLLKLYSNIADIDIEYSKINLPKQLKMLEEGMIDIALDLSFSEARAEYLHYSIPYREERYSYFMIRDLNNLKFINLSDFLMNLNLKGLRLGLVQGIVYADPVIQNFFNETINQRNLKYYENSEKALEGLLRGEIDGLIDDQRIINSLKLKAKFANQIQEIDLKIHAPVHIAFSKKTVAIDTVEKFNNIIKQESDSQNYKNILKEYLLPLNLSTNLHKTWFNILSHLGIICFAIAGVIVAAKYNTNLLGAIIFTFLPTVGGGIVRDLMLNTEKATILFAPTFVFYILFIAICGFTFLRFIDYKEDNNNSQNSLIEGVFHICDAIGQGVFIVIGVAAALINKVGPLELWGPFFAFLSAQGGGMIRDAFIKDKINVTNSRLLNAEVSIIWGLIFSYLLTSQLNDFDTEYISNIIWVTVIGSVTTSLLLNYFKVPNISFYNTNSL